MAEAHPITFGACNTLGRCLRCEYSDLCADEKVTENCAGKMGSSLEDIFLFKEDAYDCSYSALGIELHSYLLSNEKDMTASVYVPKRELGGGHLSKAWALLRQGRKLTPLIAKPLSRKFHLRGSEWGCDIARIIAKLDNQKLINKYGLKVFDKYSRIGVVLHALCNLQNSEKFQQNHTWELLNLEPVPRHKYCEVQVHYTTRDDIEIRGHTDSAFTFGNDYIGDADFKHAMSTPYLKQSKKRQVLTYAAALNQMSGDDYKWIFGFLIMRPFVMEDTKGKYKLPKYRDPFIVKNQYDCEPIKFWIDGEWFRSYKEQAQLLHCADYFIRVKEEKMADRRGCHNYDTGFDCFSKPICDLLTEQISSNPGKSLIDIIDDEKVAHPDWIVPAC